LRRMGHGDLLAYYPVMLRLEGQRCLVVGGGGVAARKVAGLLEAGACVVVVAPSLCEELKDRVGTGEVEWVSRDFCAADLAATRLVIAATDNHEVNRSVAAVARQAGIWINVVDQPDDCDFVAPAVLRRGPLVVAVSTGGSSPALARELRNHLGEVVGPEYGELAAMLGSLRGEVKEKVRSLERREGFWNAVLALPLLEWLREGRGDLARERIRGLLDEAIGEGGESRCK